MRWVPLARREAYTVLRTKGVWLLSCSILAYYVYVVWIQESSVRGDPIMNELGSMFAIAMLGGPVGVLVPLGALLVSYRSISGERELGSIGFTAGMPITRLGIIIGKVVGRFVAVAITVLVAIGVVAFAGSFRYSVPDPLRLVGFVLVTLLFVLVYVAIGTAISASTRTSSRAATAIVSFYVLVQLLWRAVVTPQIYGVVSGTLPRAFEAPAVGWLFLLRRVSPGSAYNVVLNYIFGVGNSDSDTVATILQFQPTVSTNAYVVEISFEGEEIPFYLAEPVAIVIFAFWLVVPLALGYLCFRNADLY